MRYFNRKIGTRGMLLVVTVFAVLVLSVLVRVAVGRLPVRSNSANLTLAQERANQATLSGLEFASSQLREDPSWPLGQPDGLLVDDDDLKIHHDRGNIEGILHFPGSGQASFRIRFNHLDGAGGADGLADPSPDYRFAKSQVSVNNLNGKLEKPAPAGNHSRDDVPPHTCLLVVEGKVLGQEGEEARQVTESVYSVVPDRAVDDGVIMAGAGLEFSVADDGGVFVVSEHRKNATDARIRLRSKEDVIIKNAKSKADAPLILENNSLKVEFTYDTSKHSFKPVYDARHRQVTTKHEDVNDSKDFYRLRWGEIDQASHKTDSDDTVVLKGGTYVYGQSKAHPGKLELRYYDMDYEDYRLGVKAITDSKTVFDGGAVDGVNPIILGKHLEEIRPDDNVKANLDGVACQRTKLKVFDPVTDSVQERSGLAFRVVGKDVRVHESDSGVKSLSFVPTTPDRFVRGTPVSDYPDPKYSPDHTSHDYFRFALRDGTLSCEDRVFIQGSIRCEGGSITSEGDVRIQAGRSTLLKSESKSLDEQADEFNKLNEMGSKLSFTDSLKKRKKGKNSSVNLTIYTKGRILVSSFSAQKNEYRNLTFNGLLYAWKNVHLMSADINTELQGGVTSIRGALVAYGADPDTGKPGTYTKGGRVVIRSTDTILNWDPSYLPNLLELQPEGSALYTIERSSLHFRR